MKRLSLLLCAGLIMSGCSWVELTENGQQVRVATEKDIGTCEKIGQTNVSVAANIGGVLNRRADIVQGNLETLARNSAADMKGDTVVPVSPPSKDGKQSFDVYRCH